ncbi:hypothetical protein QWZ16_15280 [Vibrio ostreicida]|uniref:Uncharacterized protein n=1 Tax=Vibrio ostreicida TaxID=526588 RepID=A0ABT8BV41_9VIBR|nr:hypothetical protein [Vibrio ostreicida]MDN3611036.1 hypothetical protein [Vibrio ostreicida]
MPNLQEIRNTVLTPLSVSQDTALRNSHSMTLAGLDLASRFDVAQVPLKTSHSVSERLDLAEFDVKTHQKNAETKSKAFAQQQIQQFRELEVKAQAAGIDVAKKAFFKELFNVALAGVGLGLSVLATAVTGEGCSNSCCRQCCFYARGC